MKMLDLGCGFKKRPGAVGVDNNPQTPSDIKHDLNVFPYPFKDNEFDDIQAINILEHLKDIVKVVEEIYRISAPGAAVKITVPHFSSHDFHTDPTHIRAFSSRSFDYFIPGTVLYEYKYSSTAKFNKIQCIIGGETNMPFFKNPLLYFINRNKVLYEKRFAFLYPQAAICFMLETVK